MHVFIADKSCVFSDFLAHFLKSQYPDAFIEQFHSASDVLKRYNSLTPDVIIMDINLSDGISLSLSETLRAIGYHKSIFIMSLFDAPEYKEAAINAGANHFLSKSDIHDFFSQRELLKRIGVLHVA